MKDVIIFGFGERGKQLIWQCLNYNSGVKIKAIADNYAEESSYQDIPIIKSDRICQYNYDEIWISTVYFKEIKEQLVASYGISENKIYFVEPVAPILENRLRNKYKEEMRTLDSVPEELGLVLSYLNDNPLRMYCYSFFDEYLYKDVAIEFDSSRNLYYGLYEGKRMYLAAKFNTREKAAAYFNSVTMEQDVRCPHCYFKTKKMDMYKGVGIDVGAAEGIFALKVIDQVEHMYLVEVDEQWIEALNYTFADYSDKVTIIRKFIGDKDDGENARLDSLFETKKIDFIKMDIEGAELSALQGAQKIFDKNAINLAVCVYHNKEDNENITRWLQDRGYVTENTKGLVVCQGEWELNQEDTDFRNAVLFASKV